MTLTVRADSTTRQRGPDARLAPDAPPAEAIALQSVEHTYAGQTGRVQALLPVDLSIPSGQFVAILGPSGCGKTTLLRIMSGLLEPSAGRVLLGGAPPADARRQRSIGWLAQDDGLLPWRNVLDNVELPLRIARRKGRADRGFRPTR